MKKEILLFISIFFLVFPFSSCTDGFREMNVDPAASTEPNYSGLFANSLQQMTDEYLYWFYDGRRKMNFLQIGNTESGNGMSFDEVLPLSHWDQYYGSVAPNLFEIRHKIDEMVEEDKVNYSCMYAVSYLPQIYIHMKNVDLCGDIPYAEANRGRYENEFSPVYDDQKAIYLQFIAELNTTVAALEQYKTDENQNNFASGDFVYENDWDRWLKLANSLKIKIAIRLYSAGEDVSSIVSSALASGVFTSRDDQFMLEANYRYGNDAVGYHNSRVAKNFTDFLLENNDPRLIYFLEKNDLDQEFLDAVPEDQLPDLIKNATSEKERRYIGGPVSIDKNSDNEDYSDYWSSLTATVDGENRNYYPLSYINRRLIDPKYNSGDGMFIDYWFSYSELCFYLAELVENNVSTTSGKTSKEWYDEGVETSIRNYEYMAEKMKVEDFEPVEADAIADYLNETVVEYVGTKDQKLEKIGVQAYLNFFKYPTENFIQVRRTGYPKENSSVLAWEKVMKEGVPAKFVRRAVVSDPGQFNRENWEAAMIKQEFSPDETNNTVIFEQRVWSDKLSPSFGGGE